MTRSAAETPTRGHKKRQRTRRQLVDAAIDVIAERGEAFSASDIAARAEVSNGTFYNYFDDRDDLVDAVVDEVVTAFASQAAAAFVDDDPVVRFATTSALALRSAAAAPDHVSVVLRLGAVQRALIDSDAMAHLRDDIDAGYRIGRFGTPATPAAVDVVVGSLLLAARHMAAGHPDAAEYTAQVVERLLHSLGASDSARSVADAATIRAGVLIRSPRSSLDS